MTATPLQGISYTGTLEYVALKIVSAASCEGGAGKAERG